METQTIKSELPQPFLADDPLSQQQVEDKSAGRAEIAEHFDGMLKQELERRAERHRHQVEGIEALTRLLTVARGHSGQCRHIAAFLLGLYNGNRFKFDLTDFRCLDYELFQDCLTVLRMDYMPQQEVHCYFKNGGQIWEQLAKDWGIRDYTKRAKS